MIHSSTTIYRFKNRPSTGEYRPKRGTGESHAAASRTPPKIVCVPKICHGLKKKARSTTNNGICAHSPRGNMRCRWVSKYTYISSTSTSISHWLGANALFALALLAFRLRYILCSLRDSIKCNVFARRARWSECGKQFYCADFRKRWKTTCLKGAFFWYFKKRVGGLFVSFVQKTAYYERKWWNTSMEMVFGFNLIELHCKYII